MTDPSAPLPNLDVPVDLTNCDREPIHRLGKIQSFGFLVAVSHDWIIQYVSENSAEWLGVAPDGLIGRAISDFADRHFLHTVRNHVQHLTMPDEVERAFDLRLVEGGELIDAAVHIAGSLIILECEPARPPTENTDSLVRRIVQRLQNADTVKKVCDTGARLVQALTGFDRVMVYRFLHDDTGEVVAESKRSQMEPFLGLRYPASDIPRQARELYKRNLIRIIADVNGTPTNVVPARAPDGMPIDLSGSVLRSVSPIHIEYLKNMGVGASMSISIVVRGRLWGLIACHHNSPRRIPFSVRTACELVGQIFSLALDTRIREAEVEAENRAQAFHTRVMRSVGPEEGPVSQLSALFEEMCALVACDGIGMIVDGVVELWQTTPTREQFLDLVNFLNATSSNSVYVTHALPDLYPAATEFVGNGAGMLAIPISRRPRDYLVFFRKEVVRTVKWAGNPEKPMTSGPLGDRLTPRKSFETWQTESAGQSEPWTAPQIRLAESIRVTLLEVVLKHTDILEGERRVAQQRQELLIAELNHRVRNILGLIRGLIRQVANPERTTADFVATLDDRVLALARAHDQLTAKQWTSGSLRDLVANEAAAYLAEKASRFRIEGPDVGLTPQAFSSMALVVHELTTNSAKYGALADRHGTVTVAISRGDADELHVIWSEHDGPPVVAPTRQGFGSVVIERSITHDLGGRAELDFRPTGLVAHLVIAADRVAELGDKHVPSTPRAPVQLVNFDPPQGPVLVVEDNVIIAMDCEALLRDLGCSEISVTSNAAQALSMAERQKFALAVLDVNLGSDTSFPIASVLVEQGVPVVFASGYADGVDFPTHLAQLPRVSKPYDKATLAAGIAEALTQADPTPGL